MAPKVPEKQQPLPLQNNSVTIKHSNLFHISAVTLCHNKRLKLKRSKYGEYLRNAYQIKRSASQQKSHKTEKRRKKMNLLKPDITIDLLSDGEEEKCEKNNFEKPTVIVQHERLSLERAAILGLMPVEKLVKPPPLAPILANHQDTPTQARKTTKQEKQNSKQQPVLIVPAPQQFQQQPRKRKSKPQKRSSLPAAPKKPIVINPELIVLSDDSNDIPVTMPHASLSHSFPAILQPDELSVTCPTSSHISCLTEQNTMQVDEEVTISLVPRSLNACASRSSLLSSNCATNKNDLFPMLPDETTVHTVIANRIYELSLTKLREGLASCGIPEFADGQQKISPQRRKGAVQQPPLVAPPQPPISLKLSSDLSISLISDDEDDVQEISCHQDRILSPAFLQKLPVNVSIAPVIPPSSNHVKEPRKLKLG